MSTNWNADALVTVRSQNVDRYKRNFLRQAVCELRFPTLMELGDPRPPAILVAALRKEYPHLALSNEVTLGIGNGTAGSNNAHIFKSVKLNWTVSLKQSALAIETTTYTDFAHFKERVLRVVEAATKTIDTDFFTRVGLRYVNVIDINSVPMDGWVNTALVEPIRSGTFHGIHEYAGRLQLTADDGGCLLQHGLRLKQQHAGEDVPSEYVLDIDTFRNEVTLDDTGAALDALHVQAFDVFDWAIGPKAREYLSSESASTKDGGKS